MSELIPSVLPLDKGLDLQTAKIISPPGTVFDSLNYEQVDFQGQKRIEGFDRYDGRRIPALDNFVRYYTETSTSGIEAGWLLLRDDVPFAVVAGVEEDFLDIIPLDENVVPAVGDVVQAGGSTGSIIDVTVGGVVDGREAETTAEAHYERLLAYSAALRAQIEDLPGAVIGLQWFRDRLYAVADVSVVALTGTSPAVYPNEDVEIAGVGAYKVLDAHVAGDTRVLFLSGTDVIPTSGVAVSRGSVQVGTTTDVVVVSSLASVIASFYESRTERQVVAEDGLDGDYGWRFVHLGWIVNFINGNTPYGSWAALNQNRQGVGIEGPTSIAGTDGSPSRLLQKVNISGRPAQVNGWKSFDSPTNYVLDPTDVQTLDATYVYADAFISWEDESATVSTPGSDMVDLIEYSPTNTAVYTD